jgi:hypothetical protein
MQSRVQGGSGVHTANATLYKEQQTEYHPSHQSQGSGPGSAGNGPANCTELQDIHDMLLHQLKKDELALAAAEQEAAKEQVGAGCFMCLTIFLVLPLHMLPGRMLALVLGYNAMLQCCTSTFQVL